MTDRGLPSGEDADTWRAYARAARHLFGRFDRELQRDAGMPRIHVDVLWLLAQAPDRSLRMGELAEATKSAPSRMSHTVARLEDAGLVERRLCEGDRRGWLAALTDAGADALERAMPVYGRSVQAHLIDPLTVEQRRQLRTISETLLAHLATEADERPPARAGVGAAAREGRRIDEREGDA